jgi:hypothetical protein
MAGLARNVRTRQADVSTPSLQYTDMQIHWQLPRTLMGGTIAMRSSGKLYLPKEAKETERNYQARLIRTMLYPGFSQTITGLATRPFRKQAILDPNLDPRLLDIQKNVDLAGRDLTKFSMDVFANALCDGIAYILVDYPNMGGRTLNLAEERKLGVRPYFVSVQASDVLEASTARDAAGKETLSRVRIAQRTFEGDGTDWGMTMRKRIRVWYPNRWEVWWQGAGGDENWSVEANGVNTLGYIPLVAVYCGWSGYFIGYPPLEDLAFLNLKHWQSQSDQDNILHVARVPILFGKAMTEDQAGNTFQVGADSIVMASDANASLQYVEHSGKAIGAGRDSLKDLEGSMAAMGFAPLVAQAAPGDLTATGRAIDEAESSTKLQAWTRGLESGISQAFRIAADWLKVALTGDPNVTLNTEFGLSLNDQADLTTLVAARNLGDLTTESFLRELQRRGVLSDDFNIADELQKIGAGAPKTLAYVTPTPKFNAASAASPDSSVTDSAPPFGNNASTAGGAPGATPQPAAGA